jgi:hypothetical protein
MSCSMRTASCTLKEDYHPCICGISTVASPAASSSRKVRACLQTIMSGGVSVMYCVFGAYVHRGGR